MGSMGRRAQRSTLAFSCALAAGCAEPRFRTLDQDPPPASRAAYHYDPSFFLRYNGHQTGYGNPGADPVTLDPDLPQPAGDLETRWRRFASPEGGTIDVVAVSPLGTERYYAEVRRRLEGTDAVVSAIRARGWDVLPPPLVPAGEPLESSFELALGDIGVPMRLLEPDARFTPPAYTQGDEGWLRGLPPLRRPSRARWQAVARSFEERAAEHGIDAVLHDFVFGLLQVQGEATYPADPGEQGFEVEGTFEAAVQRIEESGQDPAIRDPELAFTWRVHREARACIQALLAATSSGERVALLAHPDTARAVCLALRARGYAPAEDVWLTAIPLLSRGA